MKKTKKVFMECPNCKKQLADNAKACPECGFDFTEQTKPKENKKLNYILATLFLVFIFGSMINGIGSSISNVVDEVEAEKQANKVTAEDIQQAENFIISLEASGLIKEIKNQCADGSQGCYRLIIDEHIWKNVANFETKQSLIIASDIYFNSKTPYKFFEGIGYNSGKKLFDMWGIKN